MFDLQAAAATRYPFIIDRNAEFVRQELLRGGTAAERSLVMTGVSLEKRSVLTYKPAIARIPLCPHPIRGLEACQPEKGWSHIQIPG